MTECELITNDKFDGEPRDGEPFWEDGDRVEVEEQILVIYARKTTRPRHPYYEQAPRKPEYSH